MKKLLLLLPMFLVFACEDKKDEENKDDETTESTAEVSDQENAEEVEKMEVPTPFLGNAAALAIGTQNFDESVEFYKALGFEELMANEADGKRFAQLSDGSLVLGIMEEDEMTYMGPSYYTQDETVFEKLQELDLAFFDGADGSDGSAIFISPDTLGFGVFNMPMEMPELKNVSAIWGNMDFSKIEYPNPVLGTFQELALTVENIDEAVEYCKNLGFETTGINNAMYPYAIMYDGLMVIGLHEAGSMWYGSALTYSGSSVEQNHETAKMLQEKGYQAFEYPEMPGNYIIMDPDGNTVFLSTDFVKQEAS